MNHCQPYHLRPVNPLTGIFPTRRTSLGYRYVSPHGKSQPYRITSTHPVLPQAILNSEFLILNWSYTFSAKERDPETGFSYFGSRYYSSDLSIWLSANSYKEVKNNDHLFVLTNDCGSDNGHDFKGYTPKNGGMVALVNAALFKGPIDGTFGREGAIAAAHEMGHMFGLNHVGNPFNLMRTGFFHNRLNSFVSSRQLGNIIRNIQFKSPLIKKVNNR